MAAIGYNNTVLNKLTKHIYDSGITDQMITSFPYLKKRYKKPLELGQDANFSIKSAWGEGIGARGDREALPQPNAPIYFLPTFDAVDQYVVLRITGKEDIRTKNGTRATASYLKDLMAESSENFWRDLEFQGFNDGTGLRMITNAAVAAGAGVTITAKANSTTQSFTPLRGLRLNSNVEFWDETVPVKVTEAVVTGINVLAGTFTCDLDTPLPNPVSVYIKGNRQREILGLGALINDTTGPASVLGLSSATPLWASTVLSNSGNARNLAIELLDQGHFASKQQNDKDPTEYWMDYTQIRKWTSMVNRNLQVNSSGPSVKVNAHNEIESFGKASVNTSSQAPSNAIFVLQGSDVELRELKPFGPVTEENADNIWQKVQGFHEFEATFWWSGQQVVKRRNLHVQIQDLSTT